MAVAALFAAAAAMSLASGFLQANAQRQAGKAALDAAKFQQTLANRRADSLEQRAGQERAASQRRMSDIRRRQRLVESRARAVAAAGGASTDDVDVVNLLGDISTEAELQALTEKSRGEELARGLEFGAQLERAGGEGQRFAGRVEKRLANARANLALLQGFGNAAQFGFQGFEASGSTIGGTGSGSPLFDKFGRGGVHGTGTIS